MTRMMNWRLNYSLGTMIIMPMRMLNSWLINDKQNLNDHISTSYNLLVITYANRIPEGAGASELTWYNCPRNWDDHSSVLKVNSRHLRQWMQMQ